MNEYQFISYVETPNEKHLGVAVVSFFGKILLRYKIVPNKDGTGYFPCAASIKMPPTAAKPDNYSSAFEIDSNSAKRQLEEFVMLNVNAAMRSRKVNPNQQAYALPQNQPAANVSSVGSNIAPYPQPPYMSPPEMPPVDLMDPEFNF